MVDKLKQLLAHALFIPSLCVMLLVLLVLFAGPYIAFAGVVPLASWVTRSLVSIGLILGFILYQYIKHLKSLQRQDKLVNEMAQTDDASDAIDAEAAALKSKFKAAFSALKETKGGPSSLTDVPWYMIIGAPGTGKTTLLSNSGLPFPLAEKLDVKALQGVGGTKNCDWWITKDAVLLDTAGRYASQDSYQKVDESGWRNFLKLIKRYRKRPISGLLVSLSMADLINQNEYERNQQITQLKLRINEVSDAFSARFPIYIVITKSDLLAGFATFFESFSHADREQIFGVTFESTTSMDNQVQTAFDRQFTALCHSVARRQWSRMAMERDSQKKSQLYLFNEQLASLQPILSHTISLLSRSDDGLKSGIVRGIYFTSGTQQGAPLDRMATRIAQVLGVTAPNQPNWHNDQRSFFIKDFLEKVVFAEANRFGNLLGFERKRSRLKQLFLTTVSVAALGLCAALLVSFNHNANYIKTADAALEQWVSQYQNSSTTLDQTEIIRNQLGALDAFLKNINGLQDLHKASYAGLGLNQNNAVQDALIAAYGRLLKTILMPYVKLEIKKRVADSSESVRQYQALKTYLMLHDGRRRNDSYIVHFLVENLNRKGQFSKLEYQQLLPHIENLVAQQLAIDSISQSLVDEARQNLVAQPLGEIYYHQFRYRYLSESQAYLSMSQLASSQWREAFVTSRDELRTIAKFFTPKQFTENTETRIQDYVDQLTNEAWVLGPENVIDKGSITKQIEQLYVSEYSTQWQQLLSEISIKAVNDVANLHALLRLLSVNDSPIFTLLNSVSSATKLTSFDLGNIGDSSLTQRLPAAASGGLETGVAQFNANSPAVTITSRFSALHEAMTTEAKTATEQRFISLLQELNIVLSFQMQNTQDPFKPLPIKGLQGFGYLQTTSLKRWTAELVSQIENAQNHVQKQHWNDLWVNQLLPQCESVVSRRYPFQPNSSNDANLVELAQLFAETGGMQRFFSTHLANLVNTQTRPWQWKPGIQSKYQFATGTLAFFERLSHIGQHIFPAKSPTPNVRYVIKPLFLDSRLAKMEMSVYTKRLSYQFGRPTPTNILWPSENTNERSEIRLIRRDNSELVVAESGLFSLNRLIDSAKIERTSPNAVEVTINISGYKTVFELSSQSPFDPLELNKLASFRCIQGL